MRVRSRTLAAIALLLAAVTLSACSSTDDNAAGGSTPAHNQADVTFATEMIPHHAQAVTMADMVTGQDVSADFAQLAADIKAAQAPEIQTMAGWLQSWGEPVPATTHGMGMTGMDHGMPGMMSDSQLQDLDDAAGSAFERMWLQMMIAHHQGAIEMAKTEQADGLYPPAIALAAHIEQTQTAEIALMQSMLNA